MIITKESSKSMPSSDLLLLYNL